MAKCITNKCRKKAQHGRYCYRCSKKRYIENNPVKYAYQTLKGNAKRRGKEFDLTFEQFEKFVSTTKYMSGRGIYKDSLHIDRKDETKGYTIDNLQILTNSKNVKKFLRWNHDAKGKPTDFSVSKFVDEPNDDDPF